MREAQAAARERIVAVRAYLPSVDDSVKRARWELEDLASPMSRYPAYRQRKSFQRGFGTVVVEVETESGAVGLGVTSGGAPACWIIEEALAPLLEGKSPADHALLWEQMYLSTLWVGRRGVVIFALSGVDLALWDRSCQLKVRPRHSGQAPPQRSPWSAPCHGRTSPRVTSRQRRDRTRPVPVVDPYRVSPRRGQVSATLLAARSPPGVPSGPGSGRLPVLSAA